MGALARFITWFYRAMGATVGQDFCSFGLATEMDLLEVRTTAKLRALWGRFFHRLSNVLSPYSLEKCRNISIHL